MVKEPTAIYFIFDILLYKYENGTINDNNVKAFLIWYKTSGLQYAQQLSTIFVDEFIEIYNDEKAILEGDSREQKVKHLAQKWMLERKYILYSDNRYYSPLAKEYYAELPNGFEIVDYPWAYD